MKQFGAYTEQDLISVLSIWLLPNVMASESELDISTLANLIDLFIYFIHLYSSKHILKKLSSEVQYTSGTMTMLRCIS